MPLSDSKQLGGNAVKSLQQKAYDYIKSNIMSRDLKPGQYLTDIQIANELGISRTPVRAALSLLGYEGFLVNQVGKGWRVYSLSLEDIREIFDIKILLEGMIAREAAGCKDNEKQTRLRDAIGRMKAAAVVKDHEAWRSADTELHQVIFAMCKNYRATRIISALNDQWYRVRIGLITMEGRVQRSNLEHEAFVTSILAGDGDKAERQMRNHLNNLRQELEHVLINMVLPFAQNGV